MGAWSGAARGERGGGGIREATWDFFFVSWRERNGGAATACEENSFLYHDDAQVDEDERMRRKTVTGSLAAWPHCPERERERTGL